MSESKPRFSRSATRRALLFIAAIGLGTAFVKASERLTVTQESDGVTIWTGDEVFARYLKRSGTRPVLWPVVGPSGNRVTRAYPVSALGPNESPDHVHHRSMWIGYEGVNGVDFWHEPESDRVRPLPVGTVRHREFVRADSTGKVATVGSRNDWLDPDGHCVCHDQRLLEFRTGAGWRAIDCTIDLWSPDGELVFGDTKEGFFAVRVAGSMKVDAGLGGRLSNSRGQVNDAAWGRPAEWLDYSGPVDDGDAGITIFAHPSNTKPAPRWHARPYGLLAANPFGEAPYENEPTDLRGGRTIAEGETLRMRFRVLLHDGRASPERLESESRDFARRFATD